MTIDNKDNLILKIDGKTKCISRKEIENAFSAPKTACANYERDNVEQEKPEGTGDKIVDKVIESFKQRSKFGQEKYNTTLENNNLGLKQWCQHIQEELMDAVNYLEKVKSIL